MGLPETQSPTRADLGRLANNGMTVLSLQAALSRSDSNVSIVPKLIDRVIAENAWQEFILDGRDDHPFRWNAADFREFLTAKRPAGCEARLDLVEKLVKDTPAESAFQNLIRGRRGAESGEVRNPLGANGRINRNSVTVNPLAESGPVAIAILDAPAANPIVLDVPPKPPRRRDYSRESKQGNSRGYALRVLETKRPELLDKVKAGELSANRAMVEAGFRPRMIGVPDHPGHAARILRRHFHGDRLAALIAALSADPPSREGPGL